MYHKTHAHGHGLQGFWDIFGCSLRKIVPSLIHSPSMRTVYALITVFLLFCVFFTRFYLCDIWGPCALPGDKFVSGTAISIVEILLLLLVAFLLGFAVAWLLRQNAFLSMGKQVTVVLRDKTVVHEQLQLLEKENHSTRKHLAEWQQEAARLGEQKRAAETHSADAQSQVSTLQRHYDSLKEETDAIRDTATKLRIELAEERAKLEKLRSEKPHTVQVEVRKETAEESRALLRSRFTPSTWQTRNDLTLISGIGPVIQKKLNDLGIYSFQQISEFTPEIVERVARAIVFFPGRIGRDNWIGQAAALAIK